MHVPFGPSDLNRVELESLRTGGEFIESRYVLEIEMESDVLISISELLAAARGSPNELDASLLDGGISSTEDEDCEGVASPAEVLEVTRIRVLLAAVPRRSSELDASVSCSEGVREEMGSLESVNEVDDSTVSIGSGVREGGFLEDVLVIPLELDAV